MIERLKTSGDHHREWLPSNLSLFSGSFLYDFYYDTIQDFYLSEVYFRLNINPPIIRRINVTTVIGFSNPNDVILAVNKPKIPSKVSKRINRLSLFISLYFYIIWLC